MTTQIRVGAVEEVARLGQVVVTVTAMLVPDPPPVKPSGVGSLRYLDVTWAVVCGQCEAERTEMAERLWTTVWTDGTAPRLSGDVRTRMALRRARTHAEQCRGDR